MGIEVVESQHDGIAPVVSPSRRRGEDAVLGERRDVKVRIVEIEREEISRLQVFDCGAILSVITGGARLRITA